ncbi:LysR substrate-binding domain-containing protein, partial [Pseudomonas aeruginosa]
AGEVLMAAGGRWNKHLADVLGQIEDLRGLKRGHVEIAVIDALALGQVPDTIRAIQARHPGISFTLHVQANDIVRRMVSAGEVDMG